MVGAGTDRTRPPLGGGPTIILVRPQLAVNIGMCARAMANFGLDNLRLVNPRQGWPRSDEYREVAYSAAAGDRPLGRCETLSKRRGGGRRPPWVYATTARERAQMKAVLSPSVAMGATAAAVGEKRGILFGPERTGLDNDEVDSIITFPSRRMVHASARLTGAKDWHGHRY
jgi:tRNA/rRNA methyltransferase